MGNTVFNWAKKLIERWYLLISQKFLFRAFSKCKIRSSFEPKRWWKNNICWLLKSSCFKLFGDGKYGLLSVKNLNERWYLLDLFEFFIIFEVLESMVFCAVLFLLFPLGFQLLLHQGLFSSNVSALSFDLLLKLNLLLGLVAFVLETLLLSIYIILPNRSYLIFLVTFQLNSKITLFVNLSYRLNPSLLMGISHSRLCVNMLM